jgi:hypothetical protein
MIFRADCNAEDPFPVHIHEVGHVVVALALGIEIESVSIAVDLMSPHPHGRTILGSAFSSVFKSDVVAREDAMRAAMFCLAGALNEELGPLYDALKIDDPTASDRSKGKGPGDDLYEAYRFADMLGDAHDSPRTLASLMAKALEILRRNRAAAAAIASELRRVRTLSGAAVLALWHANGGELEPEVEESRGSVGDSPSASPIEPRRSHVG